MFPLLIDTSLYGPAATITNAVMAGSLAPNPAPQADAGLAYEGRIGDLLKFDGRSSAGAIETYAWDIRDGATTTGSSATAIHGYGSAGTYTARLTVTDDDGTSSTITVPVTIGVAISRSPVAWTQLSEDPIGPLESPNPYAYVGGNPVVRVDPMGEDWLYAAAQFSAGFGDAVSFGLTKHIRSQWGVNDVVDERSGWYKGGVYTELTVELTLTGGSGILKALAKRTTQTAARAAAPAGYSTMRGWLKAWVNTSCGGRAPRAAPSVGGGSVSLC
jgi:hypothetical protein